MGALYRVHFLRAFHRHSLSFIPIKQCPSSFSSTTYPSTQDPFLLSYLTKIFKFPKSRAETISNRFINNPKKPQLVINLLKRLGFSDAQIISSIRSSPQILFANADKTLKPKLQFFQKLGLVGADLGNFISKNSTLLTASLDRKLIPCVEILKKILLNDDNNENLIRVLRRCHWIISKDPNSGLLCNISFLESCGIVGSQLSTLLTRQPWLFVMQESLLRVLVSRVVSMGISTDSRMFVHGLYTISTMSSITLARKFELLRSLGFSELECREVFKRMPSLMRTSEKKLKLGIEFFTNTIKFKRTVLIYRPSLLMLSIEDRVIPRYTVLQILKSKRLLKKEPSFIHVLNLPEGEFLEKYVSRFVDDAQELLVAYKGDRS